MLLSIQAFFSWICIRCVIELAGDANDEPTADLLTQRMQIHEKNAWMLRSMLA